MKLIKWLDDNILLVLTLILLVFIPLYPKFPTIGINNTWVYIRLEDFLVGFSLLVFVIQLIRKKLTINTPLTVPILIFWAIGALSTIFAVIFIFPHLANVFVHVAWLYMLRHVEYLFVFFLAYNAIKNKNNFRYFVIAIGITLLFVCLYGYGQRGFIVGFANRFPAFSTMNEEFAKGAPLYITLANRVQSTFAGHYDLAAYLIMVIPLMASLAIGVRKWFWKAAFIILWFLGLVLLLMTASRVSFAVYLIGISIMLILQKQKKLIVPVILISIFIMSFFQGMSERFAQTITAQDIVYDEMNHKVIGIGKENNGQISVTNIQSNGEELPPSSSGFINIPGDKKGESKVNRVKITHRRLEDGKEKIEITSIEGNYVLKKALALDISFTTRFQGEWPRAIDAFKRNILLGSGYSAINAATDNNYLRILGETGIMGFLSFVLIFTITGIVIYRLLPFVNNNLHRSFILGVAAGITGLSLNAILIDVFEASKVAFILWLLVGLMLGLLNHYSKKKIDYYKDLSFIAASTPAIAVYLLIGAFVIFSPMLTNFFVADDFTWLRWIADCNKVVSSTGLSVCESWDKTIMRFFTDSQGFFYRPGMKMYFYVMYAVGWLNPAPYHVMSLILHFSVTFLSYLILFKITGKKLYSALTALIFLLLSNHAEAVFWISAVGHLQAAFMIILAVWFNLKWRDEKRILYLIFCMLCIFAAPLFQETGIIAALVVIGIDHFYINTKKAAVFLKQWTSYLYLVSIPVYLVTRKLADAFWSGGDYSFKLNKLPFNIFGNIFGYFISAIAGPSSLPFYNTLRNTGKNNYLTVALFILLFIILIIFVWRSIKNKLKESDIKIIGSGLVFFVVPLIPVLGLGNIALRYSYLASLGVIVILVFIFEKLFSLVLYSKKLTWTAICFAGLIFAYFHTQQLLNINSDWQKAGAISNELLTSMNYTFWVQEALPQNPVFYFVNTPTRIGQAWVFPVGLRDALWFTFQDSNLNVITLNNLNLALDQAEGSVSARVFEFNRKGNVEEVIKTQ